MITDAEWISSPIDIGEVCPIFTTEKLMTRQQNVNL